MLVHIFGTAGWHAPRGDKLNTSLLWLIMTGLQVWAVLLFGSFTCPPPHPTPPPLKGDLKLPNHELGSIRDPE